MHNLTRLAPWICLFVFSPMAWAEECIHLTEQMLENHPRLGAVRQDVLIARANVGRAKGGWFPDMRVGGNMGPEIRKSANGGTFTSMNSRTITMTVNQLLWDFGKTNAEISKADLALLQAESTLNNQREELLMDSATACINLLRGYQMEAMAQQSVENIRNQTGLEESRVELGGGLLTDALQARSQLAGAQARHARAKGALNMAVNRYRYLFSSEPGSTLFGLESPKDRLPPSLDKILEETIHNNAQVQVARIQLTLSQMEEKRIVGAELSPHIGAVLEKKYKQDAEGIDGNQQELSARMELSYPFNFGLASFYSLDSAKKAVVAARDRLLDTQNQAEEQARNGWESLKTAQENVDFLENQARIAAEFLHMAREERLQGGRSLIDVLSGETGLINAQSDAVSAQADLLIAQFSLLKIMGLFDLSDLKSGSSFPLSGAKDADSSELTKAPTPKEVPTPIREKAEPFMATLRMDANIRDQPNKRSKVMMVMSKGQKIKVVGKEIGWLSLENGGWIAAELVFREGQEGGAIEQDNAVVYPYFARLAKSARLRIKPNPRAKILKVLAQGMRVEVVGINHDGQWLQLKEKGWVAFHLLQARP